jgi:hypothetical protein
MKKNPKKRKSVWTKPKEGYVLINVDASYDPDPHTCGLGVVIGDEHGRFLRACNNPISYEIDANTTEARDISRGICIIIQSDCLQVIEIFLSRVFSSMAAATLYKDIYI